jgi:hypothetical protein
VASSVEARRVREPSGEWSPVAVAIGSSVPSRAILGAHIGIRLLHPTAEDLDNRPCLKLNLHPIVEQSEMPEEKLEVSRLVPELHLEDAIG